MTTVTLGSNGFECRVEVPSMEDKSINMKPRGVPDFHGVFLGQYTNVDSSEFDLYYISREDTFIVLEVSKDQDPHELYSDLDDGSYWSCPILHIEGRQAFLEEGYGDELGVAFRRWVGLQPKVEVQDPKVGMCFKKVAHERWNKNEGDIVHIFTHYFSGWWGIRRQPDGKFLSNIDNYPTIDVADFHFLQTVGRVVILDEVVDMPSWEDNWEDYNAWEEDLDWAPGHSPKELKEEFEKMFGLNT